MFLTEYFYSKVTRTHYCPLLQMFPITFYDGIVSRYTDVVYWGYNSPCRFFNGPLFIVIGMRLALAVNAIIVANCILL